ncbi:MAG TPA: hypothetical protein VGP69_05950 [Gaiellaceae bacterium]|jgi:rubredoxin|nr:hypothetical protein [Gaiellaceae bacterium]
MVKWHCRVCGLEYSAEEPEDLPWGLDECCPDYTFCDCCGVEFGYQDFTPFGARRFRSSWLEDGARWDQPDQMPDGWNIEVQLMGVPEAYR